jgi:nucleotide-binding universal stress UspA family protein
LNRPVVVGVDGSGDGLRALDFAVAEADRRGCGVRIVHAYYALATTGPAIPPLPESPHDEGQQVLSDAVKHVRDSGSAVPIETVLRQGSAVHALLAKSVDAPLVILGRRQLHGVARFVLGSTSTAVAAKATSPVVSVPAEWMAVTSARGRVVVGVDGSGPATAALQAGFEAAAAREAELVVLHASAPTRRERFDIPVETVDEWRESAEVMMGETLAGWADQYPDVAVRRLIEREHPAEALIAASNTADLLVVGRHGRGALSMPPVGSVARAVLAGSSCPVAVVPDQKPAAHHHTPGPTSGEVLTPTY